MCTPGCATSAAPTSPSPGRRLSAPCGHAGGVQRLDDRERAGRRLLGGLEHDAVAGREAGGDHPGGDREREVPRADDGDDAARGVAERVALAGQLDEPVAAPRARPPAARSTRGSRSPRRRRRRPPPTASRTRGRRARRAAGGGGAARRRRGRGSRRARGRRAASHAGAALRGGLAPRRRRRRRSPTVACGDDRGRARPGRSSAASARRGARRRRSPARATGAARRARRARRPASRARARGAARAAVRSMKLLMGRPSSESRSCAARAAEQERVVGGVLEQPADEVAHAGHEVADRAVGAHAQAHAGERLLEVVAEAAQDLELEVASAGRAARARGRSSGRCGEAIAGRTSGRSASRRVVRRSKLRSLSTLASKTGGDPAVLARLDGLVLPVGALDQADRERRARRGA